VTTTSQPAGGQPDPLLDGLVEEVELRERVRARYAGLAELAASGATCGCGQPVDCGCGAGCRTDENQLGVGGQLYGADERGELPEAAVLASLGCGNPTAVAELRARTEYEAGLAAAGFTEVSVAFTHQVADGLHAAIVKATKPATLTEPTTRRVLPLAQQSDCC
jgi:arsenite methyltransferase